MVGHDTHRKVRTTLIHEMAHAVTNQEHGEVWLAEMRRLRRAERRPIRWIFFVPYFGEAHVLVPDFENAALAGTSWEEAVNTIFYEEPTPEVYKQCRRFFRRAERRRKRGMSHAA